MLNLAYSETFNEMSELEMCLQIRAALSFTSFYLYEDCSLSSVRVHKHSQMDLLNGEGLIECTQSWGKNIGGGVTSKDAPSNPTDKIFRQEESAKV